MARFIQRVNRICALGDIVAIHTAGHALAECERIGEAVQYFCLTEQIGARLCGRSDKEVVTP